MSKKKTVLSFEGEEHELKTIPLTLTPQEAISALDRCVLKLSGSPYHELLGNISLIDVLRQVRKTLETVEGPNLR